MSSKTGAKVWSMGRRMAAWSAGSAAVLLVVATTSLYLTIAAGLDAEGDKWLGYSIDYLRNYQLRTGHLPDPDDWPTDDIRIRDDAGRVLFATPAARDRLPPALVPGAAGVNHRTAAGRWFRALSRRAGGRIYEVSYERTRELELLGRYRHYMAFVLAPALLASAVAGIVIARRGLRPLGEIAATARRIGPERLGERIAADGLPAELGDLARTFNVMLDRLQDSFGRLERFSGDIAHELRTPVHAIRNVAEVALATSRTRDDDREALATCLDAAEHLSRLIERLLFLARVDDPRTGIELETFDMASELAAVREFYVPAAEEAGIELAVGAPPRLACRLDRTLFQRALGNLLTNALTHTPEGGRVVVSAFSGPEGLVVSVSDTGVGIAPEHLPRLFDRFYRPDPARSSGQGVGLGLAIVKSIAELHGGRVSVASRPGAGCEVTLILPDTQHDEIVISA
jgi:two-component system, OmpR family, heavy metal sensor histidine kinase CusS